MITNDNITMLEILIVDALMEDAEETREIIVKNNHSAKITNSGISAIEMAYRYPFDLILMEINTKEIDGFKTTKAIRSFPEGRGALPIIALTNTRDPEDVRRSFAAGMNNFILKPLTNSNFLSAISLYAFKKSQVS